MRPLRRWRVKTAPFKSCTSVMGTVVYQEVYGINGAAAAEKALRELHRLDALWSPYRPGNIVDVMRKAAGKSSVSADPDTLRVLLTAKELGALSGGVFDITADPLIELWRKAARETVPPRHDKLEEKLALVNFADLQINCGGLIYLPRPGQGLDLGGIGKGYAADQIYEIYREAGVRHAVLNIGGNVLVLNGKADGTPWKIGIKNPAFPQSELVGYIEATNCSVVTSGDYEQFFEYTDPDQGPRRYHHIIDPRSGWPADSGITGVTVVSPSSTLADVLATAVFILGIEKGIALCHAFADAHALVINKQGRLHMTEGMSGLFTPMSG